MASPCAVLGSYFTIQGKVEACATRIRLHFDLSKSSLRTVFFIHRVKVISQLSTAAAWAEQFDQTNVGFRGRRLRGLGILLASKSGHWTLTPFPTGDRSYGLEDEDWAVKVASAVSPFSYAGVYAGTFGVSGYSVSW